MSEDFYNLLGVSRGATDDEIAKAYREMARRHHPDLNPDDKRAKERFQQLQRAYDVLKDPEKRKLYDRFGPDFEKVAGGGAGPGGGGPEIDLRDIFGQFGGAGGIDLGDLFGAGGPFGGGAGGGAGAKRGREPRSGRVSRGRDLELVVTVPFATAILGGTVSVAVARSSGTETVQVKVPAGIDDGQVMRLRGQGEPSPRKGQAGDLMLTIRVAAHPSFERQGSDLQVRVPISVAEAALGAKIDVPTPHGTVTLSVPKGSSSGRRLRIKGYGVRPSSGDRGDLYAELTIVLPEHPSAEEQRLYEELLRASRGSPRERLAW